MFGKSSNFMIDSPINAMAVNRDGNLLAICARNILKVYNISESNPSTYATELYNMRSSNLKNLNFSNHDVAWCPLDDNVLATGATNGAVVVWNVQQSQKSKCEIIFNDHKRTVNRVCFHSADPNLLLSGSMDGCIKLFDLRTKSDKPTTFVSNGESVRDVQFSPTAYSNYHFASVQETGNVEIWDIRKTEKPECNFIAHDGPCFACEWHPSSDNYKWLATGSRDKTIKVWDLSNRSKPALLYNVHTIAPVAKIKWRPTKDFHIGSSSLVVDYSVYVWDIKRPYVPYAIFETRKDVTTGFAWKNDPMALMSSSKDGTVYKHRFESDAYYPAEHYQPIGIDINPVGDIAFSFTEFIHRYSQYLNSSNAINGNRNSIAAPIPANNDYGGRLMKASSLGMNSMMTACGISTIPNHHYPHHQVLSSSLTQNNAWEVAIPTSGSSGSSAADNVKTRLMAMGNYLPSQFQYNTAAVAVQQPQHSYTNSSFLGTSSVMRPAQPIYNISSPISYKTTPELVLCEHFRCMASYMMFFHGRNVNDPSHGLLQNENRVRCFIECAKSYQLQGRMFEELCEFNAQIAESVDCHQIAQTWRIVRHMFSLVGRMQTTSSGGGAAGNNPSGSSLPNMPLNDMSDDLKAKTENPSRHTSGGTRHFSGNNPAGNAGASNQLPSSTVQNLALGSTVTAIKDHFSDDEDIVEITGSQQYMNPLKGLSKNTIPSNQFATDFFDVTPTTSSLEGGGGVMDMYASVFSHHQPQSSTNRFDLLDDNQDWELQRESIQHRHQIEWSLPINDFVDRDPLNYETNSPVSFDEDESDLAVASETLEMADTNMLSLLHAKNPPPPKMPFVDVVVDMLRHYVDAGDVQTSISIILVLGAEYMPLITAISKETINVWFRSYIDLLNRYRLFNVSARLIQQCPDSDIHAINQTSTTVLVWCAQCRKVIRTGTVCNRCGLTATDCSVCHVSVRGLYAWCQGCAHGGHLQHMHQWFKNNVLCPAGCGHKCEIKPIGIGMRGGDVSIPSTRFA